MKREFVTWRVETRQHSKLCTPSPPTPNKPHHARVSPPISSLTILSESRRKRSLRTQPFADDLVPVPRSTCCALHVCMYCFLQKRHVSIIIHFSRPPTQDPRLLLVVTRGRCCSRWLSPKTLPGRLVGSGWGGFLSMT